MMLSVQVLSLLLLYLTLNITSVDHCTKFQLAMSVTVLLMLGLLCLIKCISGLWMLELKLGSSLVKGEYTFEIGS